MLALLGFLATKKTKVSVSAVLILIEDQYISTSSIKVITVILIGLICKGVKVLHAGAYCTALQNSKRLSYGF